MVKFSLKEEEEEAAIEGRFARFARLKMKYRPRREGDGKVLLAPRNAQDSIFLNDCWTADGIKRKEGEPLTDDGHVGCATNRLEVGLVSRHFALKSIKRDDGRRR